MEGVRRSWATERRELSEALDAYEKAKRSDAAPLKKRAGNDLGALMIAARITKRLSQKDLARKLGLREQQIQRYEADRYKSITLANYQKVADILGAQLSVNIEAHKKERTLSYGAPSGDELAKVLQHARANGWVDVNEPEESAASQLVRYVVDHVLRHGTPSLLRTGLDVVDHAGDWTLLSWKAQVTLSWKAQVTRAAERIIAERKPVYRPIDVSWLTELVRLSRLDDGPARARDALLGHGVVLVIEPHITGMGMGMDGAAFLVEGVPVIGMTLLRDAVDNFWFTLLHEIAHVVLHYRTGLSAGFFDDVTSTEVDELEGEANAFAGNLLIPEEVWTRSPARIAKTAEPVERLAQRLGIHPAIVFGRIRLERRDYSLFSNKIGRGLVRRQLMARS